jgi:hypothetical protein
MSKIIFQLLGTVKKLLGVCADFSEYMQNLRHSGADDFTEDVARLVSLKVVIHQL